MSEISRSAARRVLGLAALSGLGLAAAPAAHAATHSADELGDTLLYPIARVPMSVLSNNLDVPVGGMDVSTVPVTTPLREALMEGTRW